MAQRLLEIHSGCDLINTYSGGSPVELRGIAFRVSTR